MFGAEVAAVAGPAPAAMHLQQPAKLTVRVRLMPDRPMPLGPLTTGVIAQDQQVGVGAHAATSVGSTAGIGMPVAADTTCAANRGGTALPTCSKRFVFVPWNG